MGLWGFSVGQGYLLEPDVAECSDQPSTLKQQADGVHIEEIA